MTKSLLNLSLLVYSVVATHALAEEGHFKPNHLAVAGGISWHDSKTSGYIGADYVRRFSSKWGLGIVYEEVSGDFDVQVFALTAKRYLDNGFNFGDGVGV